MGKQADGGDSGRVLRHERVYSGHVLDLDLDEVEEPGGVRGRARSCASAARWRRCRCTRTAASRSCASTATRSTRSSGSCPAGRRDPGETAEEGARRELEEEVGLRPRLLEPLLTFWTTPGFCDELMHLFRATGLASVPARPEADERIEAALFTLQEAEQMIRRGEIREGKTLVALLLELQRRSG